MDRTLDLIVKAQQGDERAKETLVEENVGLVWSLVKRFANRGYEMEDLFQIGSIGLIKSIEKFDLAYNVKFSTYAVPMIIGEIKRFLRDDGMIKVSRSLKEVAYKAKLLKEELVRQLDREPTINEIAIGLDLPIEDIVVALEANTEIESLSAVIHQGDGKPITLEDKIDQAPKEQSNMIDNILLNQLIDELDDIEKEIITYRYFEDRTQTEIASMLSISQVQVSRIEKRILKKMREMLKNN
ncbi:RNA polymerase sigma-F factor [Candidatus Epulonipiscium fishelsonii]|uniref:RNA polymerase sigma-F factor n=1 Tax=Candidatus Epulonipiscium fishelsonii TaxID=77094 RepID=A0ACC8XDP6_9FIRM|nr:RNA polymerase sigma-F factor [Epulopiscium sp. SCG-B05WGA-EpuloA1]ONI41022.1 RNA polymerase sigma-F factor [Epulopiscium sp. SCG-B11WGA-EpuloA1]ONI47402.1 RNA polymerase sigma-F factor [Epulopiscium sp. SCG-C06WGA-EpuloA1]